MPFIHVAWLPKACRTPEIRKEVASAIIKAVTAVKGAEITPDKASESVRVTHKPPWATGGTEYATQSSFPYPICLLKLFGFTQHYG